MAESSPLQSSDAHQLLQAALEHPFEPAEVPSSTSQAPLAPVPPPELIVSEVPPSEEDTWQTAYSAQVSEWRAQSASARTKAEHARAKWEVIRATEDAERKASGHSPQSWDGLGDHITTSAVAATEVVTHSLAASVASLSSVEHVESHIGHEESVEHASQHGKLENGSPSQRWEHLSATSSYPSMSFPEASVPQSPSHQPVSLPPTSASLPVQAHLHRKIEQHSTHAPSTLPSVMDSRIAPRTRLSLVLSSLAINLLLPFINGIMLGFGELFAKNVIVGWFGWKSRPGSIAAGLGLRR